MAKPPGASLSWAVLVAIFAGGVAAVGTVANYAEGALQPFFVLVMGILGTIASYVTLPIAGGCSKKTL